MWLINYKHFFDPVHGSVPGTAKKQQQGNCTGFGCTLAKLFAACFCQRVCNDLLLLGCTCLNCGCTKICSTLLCGGWPTVMIEFICGGPERQDLG